MSRRRVLAFIMAGGKGERLAPLTRERSKPAVPFGGRYRIIDFVLSNFVNSGHPRASTSSSQYKSQSLMSTSRAAWRMRRLVPDHFVTVVPAQMRTGDIWYRGTADAVFQNLHLMRRLRSPTWSPSSAPTTSTGWTCDQMLDFHVAHDARVTVAALPVPVGQASGFGVIEVDGDGPDRRLRREARRTRGRSPAARSTPSPRWATTSSTRDR